MLELNDKNINNVKELFIKVYQQEDASDKNKLRRFLEIISTDLTSREERVLVSRYGLDGSDKKSLEEMSKYFNSGREKIRQIEIKAIHKLLHPNRRKYILGQ